MKDEIYTYVTTLPPGVHEIVTPCFGGYTVYIDERLDDGARIDAYQHALRHITGSDFEKTNVQEIEEIAHSA